MYKLDTKKECFIFEKREKKEKTIARSITLDVIRTKVYWFVRSFVRWREREIGSSLEGIIRLATGQLVLGTLLLAGVFISWPDNGERTAWNDNN